MLTHTRAPSRFKAADIGENGVFTGYGSVFNVVDSGGDMIVPGAFAASLKRHAADATRPKMLWQHDPCQPIGSWVEVREDDYGLLCRGQLLLDVPKAREAYALMKAGEIDGLSIGYEVVDWESARADELEAKFGCAPCGYGLPAGQVRVLRGVDLWEISPVTFPMNEVARIDSVKLARGDSPAGSRPPRANDLTPILAALQRRENAFA